MIRETPTFWENYINPRLENEFGGVDRHQVDESGRNQYVERVEAKIDSIRQQIAVMPECDRAAA
jgi:hypothetical protein